MRVDLDNNPVESEIDEIECMEGVILSKSAGEVEIVDTLDDGFICFDIENIDKLIKGLNLAKQLWYKEPLKSVPKSEDK